MNRVGHLGEADRLGQAVYDYVPEVRQAAEQIANALLLESMAVRER